MFGSLMMFASGVLASSPSSASASATRCSSVRRSGNWARMRPASEMSRSSMSTPAWPREGLDDRQERVRRQCRRLVRVGVDELHQPAPEFVIAWPRRVSAILVPRWPTPHPPAICCAPRTSPTPATPSRWTSTTWRPPPGSRARTSRASSGARSARRRTCYLLTRRLERAAALLRTTDRSIADICFAVGLHERRLVHDELHAHVREVAAAYRASFPPAVPRVVVPSCVVRAYGRPQHRTFREDNGAPGT